MRGGKGSGGKGPGRYRKIKEPQTFLPKVKSAEADFKSWSFVFLGYLEDQVTGAEGFLEWAEKREEEIKEEEVEGYGRTFRLEGVREIDALVSKELRGLCPEGEPQMIIKNLKDITL